MARPRDSRLRRALTAGDRPYVIGLVAVVGLVAAMALGPLQVFTAAADRVDELERQRERLQQEVDVLEDRERQLEDPEEVELLARSELGLVRPGEIPFVVVTPQDEHPRIARDLEGQEDDGDAPWYRRLGRWIGDRISGR